MFAAILDCKLWPLRKKSQDHHTSEKRVGFDRKDAIGRDELNFRFLSLTVVARGFEFAGQYEPIEGVAFLGVATVGTAQYMSNPHLLHQTAPTAASRLSGFDNGTQVFGFSYLQGYPLANGPQQAYSLGFEYKDPNYWRMGLHVNYFSHAYVAINAFRRTRNFYQDFDGIPFADYDSKEAESILAPERIPSYFTLNATASKSWRLGKQYVGFFISVQNLLNSIQKRGDLNKRVMPIIKPCW